MDYTTAYSWMVDNATREQIKEFELFTDESEAIYYAESLGAYDALEDFE